MAFLTILWKSAEDVTKAFSDAGIEYRPLKGIKTKDLYPNKFMRHMSDVDILIHEEDYVDKIKPIMLSLGWSEGYESDHELHWHKSNLTIELHKRIIPSYNKDYYNVIGDGWEWFEGHTDCEYNFIHFAKHYRDAGVGIGHLVEMEICRGDMDLSDIGLEEFKNNINKTLDNWFNGGEPDEKTELITDVIFSSGEYSTEASRKSSADIKLVNAAGGSRLIAALKSKLGMLFLPWYCWKDQFPILNNAPYLLPVFFVWRIIRTPFRRSARENLTRKIHLQEDYRSKLSAVGLKYDF